MDKIRTSYISREDTLDDITEVIFETVSAKVGHYMVFAPSFTYAEALYRVFSELYPEYEAILQTREMNQKSKNAFISKFKDGGGPIVGFCVMGGIYSEGIDLAGDCLIGAVVVGVGIPQISDEREALREYYDDKSDSGTAFAYIYPGMNRVLQAAGAAASLSGAAGAAVSLFTASASFASAGFALSAGAAFLASAGFF